ncbi:MAG TPA: hypothetical protein VFY92_10825 [Hyphomicrobiaceae bacterium]|nr:hypothetical protein [Hyphomicrobiaceae bacterium]
MAVKSDIEADLTLEIDGRSVTPEKFLRGVRSFFALLNEVTTRVAGKRGGVEWRVHVKAGSNLIGVLPEPGFDRAIVGQIVAAVSEGVSSLESRAEKPRYFTERAVKSLRELADVVGKSDRDDTMVRIWAKKEPIPVTHHAVANIGELLSSEHEDYGSIEGKLQTVTDRGGLQFVVYEPLWDRAIRCRISEQLTELAITNFRKRVEVYGLIRYRKDGKPVSIQADDIVPFPDREQIPSFRDVHGILREAS